MPNSPGWLTSKQKAPCERPYSKSRRIIFTGYDTITYVHLFKPMIYHSDAFRKLGILLRDEYLCSGIT
jgi:hypothetical protein